MELLELLRRVVTSALKTHVRYDEVCVFSVRAAGQTRHGYYLARRGTKDRSGDHPLALLAFTLPRFKDHLTAFDCLQAADVVPDLSPLIAALQSEGLAVRVSAAPKPGG